MPLPALALAGLMAGGQSILNAGLGAAGSVAGYHQNKQLMALQNKYAIDAFNRENERQDYLLANQGEITRNSMANAGYSAADPSGVGMMTPDTSSMQSPSNPSMSPVDLGKIDLMQARLLAAQAENIEADTVKKTKETEGQEIDNWLKSTFGEQQWSSAIKNLDADTQNKISQALYADQKKLNETNLTEKQIDQIEQSLDMAWQRLTPELQLMAAQAYEAESSGHLSHVQISKVWQDIRESQQRIVNLQHEVGLTDAQVAVAIQQVSNLEREHDLIGAQSVSAKAQAELDQLYRDIETGMGMNFWRAKRIVEAVLPIGAIGAALGLRLGGPSSPTPIRGFSK